MAGRDSVFIAELAADVGSPGSTTGPVMVHVLQEPFDTIADSATVAQFSIAGGLPRPRYQWLANNAVITGATGPTLEVATVIEALSGTRYYLYGMPWERGLSQHC